VLIGVPRLFQALLDGVRARAQRAGWLACRAFEALLATAIRLRRATGGRIGAQLLAPVRRRVAPGLRMMVSGGAQLKPGLEEALVAFGWDLRSGYGLSETAAAFSATFGATPPGSVGRPILDGEVRIEEPDETGIGQILVRGPTVFSGYLDAPEEDRDAFDAEGFFRTGDLGRIDADGNLYVTGRKKETIVLPGGDTLNPEDVEAAYLADPQIREIGVFERDGVLRGVVVPETAEIAARGITDPGEAVRVAVATIGRGLPSTWRLSGVVVTREPLPRTRLGKIRRFLLPDLHDRAAGGGGAEPRDLTEEERAWVETPPRAAAWEILAREAGDRPFDLDSHLQLDLGIDSFGWMTLAVALEEEAGVRLSTGDIAGIGTVREYLETVTRKAEAPGGGADLHADELARARRWLAPRSLAERLAGRLVHRLVGGLVRLLFRLDVTGAERLPAEGAILICPNHASDLDPAVLAAALPRAVRDRAAWAGERRRVFGSAVLRALARPLRVFPVDERVPMVAVDIAVEALGEGAAQVWFPEGWRSPDGRLLPFQPGIGHVVERAGCPVVPVHIAGTLDAWPRDRRWPRPGAVSVSFGAPVAAEALLADAPEGRDRPRAVAAALHDRVAALARSRGAEIG
jgi:long-chain acyl-CoA synthetase